MPIGIAALLLAPRAIAESRAEAAPQLDVPGAALAGATLVAIVLPLVEGRRQGWPLWTFVCLAAAVPLALAFVARQRRLAATGGAPLVHPELFRERAFTVGVLAIGRLLRRDGLVLPRPGDLPAGGLRPLGARLGPRLHRPGGRLPRRLGGRRSAGARFGRQVLAAGGVVRAVALAGLALTVAAIGTGGSPLLLVPALAVDGIGMGLLTAPLVSTVVGGMDPRHAGAASGVLSTAQQVGNTIGVAAVGALFYGALGSDGDFAGAFEIALVAIAAICLAVAVLVQLLPGRPTNLCAG